MIYLIAIDQLHVCKIGFAVDVSRRLATLQTGCPIEYRLIATREGDVVLERALHRTLEQYRRRGEWFTLCDEVLQGFHGAPVAKAHTDIVRSAGKPEEVAATFDVSVHTVRSWIQRDSIPADQWAAFAEHGFARLEDLAAAARRQTGQAA